MCVGWYTCVYFVTVMCSLVNVVVAKRANSGCYERYDVRVFEIPAYKLVLCLRLFKQLIFSLR
jgi:hypothetical protein